MAPERVLSDPLRHFPDDVIHHITSYLPFRYAIRTKILSKQWRNAWAFSYIGKKGTIDDAVKALTNHLTHVQEGNRDRGIWGIRFESDDERVLFATVSPNRILHLDYERKGVCQREFGWALNVIPGDGIALNIRSLYLVSVDQKMMELVDSLIPSFRFLGSLTLVRCNGLRSFHVNDNTRIRKLTILDCLSLRNIRVNIPHLASFLYRGKLPWFFDDIESLSNDVMLDVRQGPGYMITSESTDIPREDRKIRRDDREFSFLWEKIFTCTRLTMCRWLFEEMALRGLLGADRFDFLKELWWIDYSHDKDATEVLIAFLRLCRKLERLFVTVDRRSFRPYREKFCCFIPQSYRLTETLEILRLEGFAKQRDEIHFALKLKKVLRVAPTVIAPTSDAKTLRLMVKRPNSSKWSPRSYYFVTEAKHRVMFSSDHPHMALPAFRSESHNP